MFHCLQKEKKQPLIESFWFLLFYNAQVLLTWELGGCRVSEVMLHQFLNYIELSSMFKYRLVFSQSVFLAFCLREWLQAGELWLPLKRSLLCRNLPSRLGNSAASQPMATQFKWNKGGSKLHPQYVQLLCVCSQWIQLYHLGRPFL